MSSRVHRDLHLSVMLLGAILLAIAMPSSAGDSSATSPFPGLEVVDSKSIDRLYRRPEVDPSDYNKILVGEPLVEFSKGWNPRNYGTYGLSAAQLKKIRVDMAALVKSTFTKVLGEGGYDVVTQGGAGVLEVTPNIFNLYITAPDPGRGHSRTYVMDAGSMTLALQINDAVTGTLLVVAYDHQRGSQFGRLQWATVASNRAAAVTILTGWAEQLKRDLDAGRAK